MTLRSARGWRWAVCVGLVLAGAPASAEARLLPITATREDDAATPADAVLDVELLDVSRADAAAVRIASQRFRVERWPAALRLRYDDASIDPRMTYVVAARLVSGDSVILRTTSAYPVLTRNAPDSATIVLTNAGRAEAAPPPGPGITGVSWAVTELGGRALVADDPPTLVFLDDGTFAMFGGCNRFRGKAPAADGRIAFSEPIVGTRRACPAPRMQLERDMLAALWTATRFERNGERLSLANDAGIAVVRLRAAPE